MLNGPVQQIMDAFPAVPVPVSLFFDPNAEFRMTGWDIVQTDRADKFIIFFIQYDQVEAIPGSHFFSGFMDSLVRLFNAPVRQGMHVTAYFFIKTGTYFFGP